MHKLVMIRHGESTWNQQNRFTGWVDVDLTDKGIAEARQAGELLRSHGLDFDLAYTSVLKRAVRTLWLCLESMDRMWLPTVHSWRLNERHYGALQGLNKAQTAARFGDEQVMLWRRSYDVRPPLMDEEHRQQLAADPRYAKVNPAELPLAECLKDTVHRVLPLWEESLAPAIRAGRRVLAVSHGNSMRAIIKHLDGISDSDIVGLNIPNGVPLVYELDAELRPLRRYYLEQPGPGA